MLGPGQWQNTWHRQAAIQVRTIFDSANLLRIPYQAADIKTKQKWQIL